MGIAQEKVKATWLKLSAGQGGTGSLYYSVPTSVDPDGKKLYKNIMCKEGIENVYFTQCRFHIEEGKDGEAPKKKFHATFVDAESGENFIISVGWLTAVARYIIYNCYHNDLDFTKPFTSVKTFYSKDVMKNGFKSVTTLMSQMPNPRAGSYLTNVLSLHLKEGIIQKTEKITNKSNGSSYMEPDWAAIIEPLVEPLNERLKAADAARQPIQSQHPSSDYAEEDYDEDGYEASEEEVDTSFFSAFNAYPVTTPQSTVVDELAPFFSKLDWGDAEKTAFYSKYGASNTPSLKAAGKLEAAKEYLGKMEEIYAISATLLPAMGATDKDRDAISKMATFVSSKGVLGLNAIDATLQKAKDLKAALVDPFAEAEEEGEDIPF